MVAGGEGTEGGRGGAQGEGAEQGEGPSTFKPHTLGDLDLDAILGTVLSEQAATVVAWQRDVPGSWGALAARSVLATRQALGRSLTDAERRIIWQALWDRLGTVPREP